MQGSNNTNPASTRLSEDQKNWMLTQSYTRLLHGQIKASITLLQGLQILCPEAPEVYSMLGYAHLKNDDPEECLKMVDKYLKIAASDKKEIKEIEWIRKRAQLRINKNKNLDQ